MNLEPLRQEIADTCQMAGRDLHEISLIAVSKSQSFTAIVEAYRLGMRDFGENYAAELSMKQQLARENKLDGIKWHYLGAIQTNKIKLIASADVIHSICQVRHAKLLDKIATKNIGIFLQVNLNPDDHRQGFTQADLADAIKEIKALPMLNLLGLMMVCPVVASRKPAFWFERLHALGQLFGLDLSMGMSEDFREAIAHGASYLRIGSKLFGPRG